MEDGEQSPRPTTAAEFAAAKTPGNLPSRYVTFQPDGHVVTGVSVLEGRRHEVRASYDLVKVGDHYAVVRSAGHLRRPGHRPGRPPRRSRGG